MPLDDILTSKARPTVLVFFTCSLLVLGIAGVNLSNLMLTRALQRTHETCLTIAFGGVGWRSRRPLIADVVAISVGALAIGLLLARALITAVAPFVPAPWLISAPPLQRAADALGISRQSLYRRLDKQRARSGLEPVD
jgi:hypothetical protein